MCPHGGPVQHLPATVTTFRVDGRLPMLLSDIYVIAGCPFQMGAGWPSPCLKVTWVSGSSLLFIKGQPALTLASVGLCVSASGAAQGPVVIAAVNTGQMEPSTPTFIID
jgi:hypothetical protein